MTVVSTLEVVIGANTRGLEQGLNSAQTQTQSFGQRLQELGDRTMRTGAQVAALGAPVIGLAAAGVRTAATFQQGLAELGARAGLTGTQIDEVRQVALQMGSDTAFSAQQALDAMLQLLTSGQSLDEVYQTLPAVLDAAAASGADLGATADTVTNIMAAFGLEASSAQMIVDALAQASGASSATIESLSEGFSNVGGVARQFGLSVDETAAILAIFAENGISGAEAGTQLRSMLLAMSSDAAGTQAAWDELGISLYDNEGNIRNLNDIMVELADAMRDMPAEEQNRLMRDLGGAYGILGLTALIGAGGTTDMTNAMKDSASAAEIAAARMGGFSGAADALQGSVETLSITALTPFMDKTLTPLIEDLTQVISGLTEWAGANPQTVDAVIKLGGALVIGGTALSAFGFAIKGIGIALVALSGPIGIAIALVGALAAAYVTNFANMRTAIDETRRQLELFNRVPLSPGGEQSRQALGIISPGGIAVGLFANNMVRANTPTLTNPTAAPTGSPFVGTGPLRPIGQRATGGDVWGGMPYVVGEEGPELFVPDGSGSIVPNGAGRGGTTVNVNVVVTEGDAARAGRHFGEALAERLRMRR